MPRKENQKLKILYIREYLERFSDPDHPVSAAQLAAYLEQQGIVCERKSIYRDLEALEDFGLEIGKVNGPGGGYYLMERPFSLPELQLLANAVQSSRFLTQRKSSELIQKLCTLCNRREESLMRRSILVSGRVKSMNESIYNIVNSIQDAIFQNSQITFHYFDWGIDGKRHRREKAYVASPYALCWAEENYYLLALSPRHGVTHYRVDRMQAIRQTGEPRVPCPELTGSALNAYTRRVFQMYAGSATAVKLRFHNTLAGVVVDRFGPDAMMIPDGPEHFTCTQEVAVSPMFLSWVIGFGSKAEILWPKEVAEQCLALCREAAAQYAP